MTVTKFGGGPARIGVVAPPDVLEQVVAVADDSMDTGSRLRLQSATFTKEVDVAAAVRRVAPDSDALLFSGPLPLDIAREAGVLDLPAAHIGVSGSSLYGALLRAREHHGCDLTRVSIDSLREDEVAEAYADLELAVEMVQVLPYTGPHSARGFADFHLRQHRAGATTVALTTVGAVAAELAAEGVPVVRVRPTRAAVRTAMRTAALLATGSAFEEAQVAVVLVDVGESPRSPDSGGGDWWLGQDLRLAAVRVLSADLAAVGATVLPGLGSPLVVLATYGAVAALTEEFTTADFAARVEQVTGLSPSVGVGLGETAADAERHAQDALRSAQGRGASVRVVMRDGSEVALRPGATGRPTRPTAVDPRLVSQAETLATALRSRGEDASVIDAEAVAGALGVTTRSARRLLQDFVRAGLAWQVPPRPQSAPGRPRQTFRLLLGDRRRAGA